MNLGKSKSGAAGLINVWTIVAGVVIIIGGFLIGLVTPGILPVQASSEAAQVDELFRWLLTIGGAIFLLVEGLLLYSVIRFRRRPGDDSDGPPIHGNVTLELIWTGIPAIIVLFLVIYSYSVWVDIRAPKSDEMVVRAVGQRYNWAFTYTDPLNRLTNVEQQTFTDSVLHTYVGRPVLLEMETRDVNHAFWVPTMRIKQDLLAGRTTTIRFTPTREGRYRIVCTELCGGGHGAMYSFIEVHPDETSYLAAFIDPRVDLILNPPADPVLQGAALLAQNIYPCSGCHVLADEDNGIAWSGLTGPSLQAIGETAQRRAGASGQANAAEYIAHSIRHPNDYIVPGFAAGLMPQFGPFAQQPADWSASEGAYYYPMSDDDLVRIVSYLCTRTSTGENACGEDPVERDALIQEAVAVQREQ